MKAAPTVTHHVRSLKRRIGAVRRKRSFVKTVTGIAVTIGILVGVLTGEAVLDMLVDLPWIGRAFIFLAAVGGAGYMLWREAIHPLRKRLNDDAIASMIEHAIPTFRTRFIASLQLARAAGKEPPHSLVRALLAETASMSAAQDFRKVIKTVKLRRMVLLAIAVLGIASGLAWLGGRASLLLLERALLFNRPLPHKTHIEIVTGDRKIGVGEDFNIDVTAGGILPSSGTIIATTASGLTRQFALEHDPAHREKYTATIRSPQESFSYYVKLNDDTSKKYKVDTILRPAISEVTCEQTYPAYVKLPPVKRSTGDLSLLVGSRLKVFVKATANISKASLKLEGLNQEIPLNIDSQDKTSLSGEIKIPAKDLTGFSVHLVDTQGVESGDSATYRIELVQDHPPTVQITEPLHREELATAQATLRIGYEAKDDFGVVKATLHYNVDQGTEKTIDLATPDGPEKDLKREFDWKLTSLQPHLSIGNALEWWITVADGNDLTGPGLGTTEHYEFKIVSDEEKLLDLQNQRRDTMEGLKNVKDNENQLNQNLGEPLFQQPNK